MQEVIEPHYDDAVPMFICIDGNNEKLLLKNIDFSCPSFYTSIVFLYFLTKLFHDPFVLFFSGNLISDDVCTKLAHEER